MKKGKEKKAQKAPSERKMSKFSLRVRLTFFVLVEIVGAIILAFAIDAIVNKWILKNTDGEVPIEVEVLAISLLVCFFITNFLLKIISILIILVSFIQHYYTILQSNIST